MRDTTTRGALAAIIVILCLAAVAGRVRAGEPVSCAERTSGYVDVWENSDYRGGYFRFCGSDGYLTNDRFSNGDGINDRISSWRFRPGYGLSTFKFYRNTGYSGDWGWNSETSAQSAHDEDYLSAYHNDTFSSIRFNP